ncbi:MAG: hypothetical protein AABX13_01795 [Nanoarchaeota archaeon]
MKQTDFENKRTRSYQLIQHCLCHQQLYLSLLALLVLTIPLILNAFHHEPLLQGGESYYHLSQARDISLRTWYYYPLHLLLPLGKAVIVLPLLAGIGCLWLFLRLTRLLGWEKRFVSLLLVLTILSPAFIWTFSTLSAYATILFLALLGLVLLLHSRHTLWAIIPWGLVSFLEGFSALLLIVLNISLLATPPNGRQQYGGKEQSREKSWDTARLKRGAVLITLSAFFFLTIVLLRQPFFIGPFHLENHFSALFSDFGARGGISFFTFLLALIGLALAWKEKRVMPIYAFVPIVVAGYIFNSHTGFYLSLLAVLTGTIGLEAIFSRPWIFPTLKRFTFFLLALGIIFSTISYLDRISAISAVGPTAAEKDALLWMKENTPEEGLVLTLREESYYVQYFAERTPFAPAHNRYKQAILQEMLSSVYIHELFPLLEEQQINIIYITPEWRRTLPAEQGFLFLLKNERFKLLYAQGGYEVWEYRKGYEK